MMVGSARLPRVRGAALADQVGVARRSNSHHVSGTGRKTVCGDCDRERRASALGGSGSWGCGYANGICAAGVEPALPLLS